MLVDAGHEPAAQLAQVQFALAHGDDPHAGLAQDVPIVIGLQRIEPGESILVPTQDHAEVAALTSVTHEPLKAISLVRFGAGDSLVGVGPQHLEAVGRGVLLYFDALRRDALVLFLGTHPEVGNRRSPLVGLGYHRFTCR